MWDNVIMGGMACVSGANVVLTTSTETAGNPVVAIIQAVVSLISILITLGYVIFKWYNQAKKDGKVTSDEIEDLLHDIKDRIDKKDDISEDDNGKDEDEKNE